MNLSQVLSFLENIDRLKDTHRKCLILSGQREENTAEHSFSLAMAVLSLSSFSNEKIDTDKAMKMALFHDLAESLMGDTFHYDKAEKLDPEEEKASMKEVLAPLKESDLAQEIYDLWEEFEYGETNEAFFLRGVDRFLPVFHNFKTQGHTWKKYGISKEKVLTKNAHIQQGSRQLWEYMKQKLDECEQAGWFG